jgi:hypothetical protein
MATVLSEIGQMRCRNCVRFNPPDTMSLLPYLREWRPFACNKPIAIRLEKAHSRLMLNHRIAAGRFS